MPISFQYIPGNLRVPLAYFEMSNEMAGASVALQNALLLGSAPAGSGLPPGVPTFVRSADQVRGLVGAGSAFARQAERWFQNNGTVPLYLLAEEEGAAYVKSAGRITWTGPATGSGAIPLYIGGRLCRVAVSVGDTAEIIAQAVADTIATDPNLGVVASVQVLENTEIVAIQAGTLGGLHIEFGVAGTVGGEVMPPGVGATVIQMDGGTGQPNIAALLAGIGDAAYDFVMCPWFDAQALDDLQEFFNDATGRWAWSSQLYGHGFVSTEKQIGNLSTLGNSRNDQHVTIMGFYGSPTPHDEWLTAYVGSAAGSLIIDPARPVQALPMRGVRAPGRNLRFTILERQVLYFDGISSYYVTEDGTVYIDRLITTYQKNQWGAPDSSYLDVETMFTAQYFNRFMKNRILTKFPRSKLADDGTRFGAGQAIVTPSIIRAEMIAAYGQLEEMGLMENLDGFEEALIVERNPTDPNRVDVLLPPDFVNQLRIFAALTQFRLQTIPTATAA